MKKLEKTVVDCSGLQAPKLNNITELVFILDRSGSMSEMEANKIDGWEFLFIGANIYAVETA